MTVSAVSSAARRYKRILGVGFVPQRALAFQHAVRQQSSAAFGHNPVVPLSVSPAQWGAIDLASRPPGRLGALPVLRAVR